MNHNSCDQCISVKIAQMIEAYSLSADPSEFVEALAELCGNPLHVTDRSYKVLACSNCENVDDEVWRDTAELGYMSSKIITDAIKMHQSTHPKKRGEHVNFVWSGGSTKYCHMVNYLYCNDTLMGYLSMLCVSGPPQPEDYEFMGVTSDLIAKCLALRMERSSGSDERSDFYADMFIDLIESDTTNRNVIQNRIIAAKLQDVKGFRLVNVWLDSNYRHMRSELQKLFCRSKVFYYEHQLLVLCMLQEIQPDISEYQHEQLKRLLDLNLIRACISDVFDDLMELPEQYQRNKGTINTALIYDRNTRLFDPPPIPLFEERIYEYDRFKYVQMILKTSGGPGKLDILQFASNSVREIYSYDKENNTELFRTLCAFLECGQSLAKTAEKIFVHRNTIVYRIEKIKQLFGCDPSDEEKYFEIYLSCVLVQLSMRFPRSDIE